MLRRLIVFLLPVVVLVSGCGSPSKTISPPLTTCDERSGPPSPDIMRCRLLRASAKGLFPRRLSPEDADRLIAGLERIHDVTSAFGHGGATSAEAMSVVLEFNVTCHETTGLSCEQLFEQPMDWR